MGIYEWRTVPEAAVDSDPRRSCGGFLASPAGAQLITFSKQDMVDYSSQNPFDRFPDAEPESRTP